MKIGSLGVAVVPKRERGKKDKIQEQIFPRYRDESIAALEESIREAEGRFDVSNSEYDPAAKAYGATNWRVVAGAQGMGETVEVFWKVGKRSKTALFEDDNGNRLSTIRVHQSDVADVLRQMLAVIKDDNFQNTKEGALFLSPRPWSCSSSFAAIAFIQSGILLILLPSPIPPALSTNERVAAMMPGSVLEFRSSTVSAR